MIGVELDDDGNVYVLDGLAPAVRVFDSDGQYVRSLGGRGAGPGEFMRPNGLIITEEGRLWVRDSGNRRYDVFESDGTHAGSFRRNFGAGLWNPVVDQDGLMWESAVRAMDPETFASELFFVAVRPSGGVMESVETVYLPQPMRRNVWTVLQTSVAEGGFVSVPFTAEWRARVDPRGGFWTGTTDALRFVRQAPEGDTIQIIERVVSPRPVSTAERDRAFEELADRFGRAALQGSAAEIPDYMPYWSTFFLDRVGRLWVERYRPPGTPADAFHTWEIYGSDGDLLGVLPLPFSGRVTPSVRNDRIAGIVEDDLGVQYVVVFELRMAEPYHVPDAQAGTR